MTNRELLYNQLVTLPDDDNRNTLYLLILNHITEGEAQMIVNRFKKEKNEKTTVNNDDSVVC